MAKFLDSTGVSVLWGQFVQYGNDTFPRYKDFSAKLLPSSTADGLTIGIGLYNGDTFLESAANSYNKGASVTIPKASKEAYGVIRLIGDISADYRDSKDTDLAVTPGAVQDFVDAAFGNDEVIQGGIITAIYEAFNSATKKDPYVNATDPHKLILPVISNKDLAVTTNVTGAPLDIVSTLSLINKAVIVDANDNILTETTNTNNIKTISTTTSLYYDPTAKKLYLLGREDSVAAGTLEVGAKKYRVISAIDTTDFVRDGFMKSCTLVDQDGDGKAGTFLKFVWNVTEWANGENGSAQESSTTYVDLEKLLDNINYHLAVETTDESSFGLIRVTNGKNGTDRELKLEIGIAQSLDDWSAFAESSTDANNRFVTLKSLAEIFEHFHFDSTSVPVHGAALIEGDTTHLASIPVDDEDVLQIPVVSDIAAWDSASVAKLATEKAVATRIRHAVEHAEADNDGVVVSTSAVSNTEQGPHRVVKIAHKDKPTEGTEHTYGQGTGQTFVTGFTTDKYGHIATVNRNTLSAGLYSNGTDKVAGGDITIDNGLFKIPVGRAFPEKIADTVDTLLPTMKAVADLVNDLIDNFTIGAGLRYVKTKSYDDRLISIDHKLKPTTGATPTESTFADATTADGNKYVSTFQIDEYGHIANVSRNTLSAVFFENAAAVRALDVDKGQIRIPVCTTLHTGTAATNDSLPTCKAVADALDGVLTGLSVTAPITKAIDGRVITIGHAKTNPTGTESNRMSFLTGLTVNDYGHVTGWNTTVQTMAFYNGTDKLVDCVADGSEWKLPATNVIPTSDASDSVFPTQKAVADMFNTLFATTTGVVAGNSGVTVDKSATSRTVTVSHRAKPSHGDQDVTSQASSSASGFVTSREGGANLGTATATDTGSSNNGWVSVVTGIEVDVYGHVASISREYVSADVPLAESEIIAACVAAGM